MIPYSTDAPIYHYPIGTTLLILANVVCFFVHGAIGEGHPWILEFGTALNPIEWLACFFAHRDFFQLIGDVYFLGAFGLIVEGKLGWQRFLPLYLAMGVLCAACTQLAMLPAGGGGAVGASGPIMALMAICLVWAPRNEFSVFMILPTFYLARGFVFDVSIFVYAILFVCWEFIDLIAASFLLVSPFIPFFGFVFGFAAGTLFHVRGWVDCENWDLFAVLEGTHGRFGDPTTTVGSHASTKLLFGKEVDVAQMATPTEKRATQADAPEISEVGDLIDAAQWFDAYDALLELRMNGGQGALTEPRLRKLSTELHNAEAIDEAELLLEEYAERFANQADWCRLRLAHILLHQRRRPRAALQQLKRVRLGRLSESQQERAKRIASQAKQQLRG